MMTFWKSSYLYDWYPLPEKTSPDIWTESAVYSETPFKEWEAAAEGGSVEHQRKLGLHYLNQYELGNDADTNAELATKWLIRASRTGDEEATEALRKCLQQNIGTNILRELRTPFIICFCFLWFDIGPFTQILHHGYWFLDALTHVNASSIPIRAHFYYIGNNAVTRLT